MTSQSISDSEGALCLPEGATHIDNWGYAGSKITSAVLPNSLRTMGMSAFKGCTLLEKVTMSPNTYCNYALETDATDGIFSGCTNLRELVLTEPLGSFVWDGEKKPVLLRGFDPEATFLHCPNFRYITAYYIPLSFFPDEWKNFAMYGYLKDENRERDYLPEICPEYDGRILNLRSVVVSKCRYDMDFPTLDYLLKRELISLDELPDFLNAAKERPDITAVLLSYERSLREKNGTPDVFSLLDDL